MRLALRPIAWGFVAAALAGVAPVVFAQQNPLVRGAITTPRVAVAIHQVTEYAATGLSPFSATCGDPGTVYIGAEVEPHIAVNPLNPNHFVAAWQQDRYSDGASRGIVTGTSTDGGVTWMTRTIPVSTCTGGTFARSTDPWVTFSPDGTVHQVVLGTTGSEDNGVSAVVTARSTDGGLTWSTPIEIIRSGAGFFNDKETITADPNDSRFVYAVWDRLQTGAGGPTLFARTTDGGLSWEAARVIFTVAGGGQTIGNLIRVLPNGTLVNLMTVIRGSSNVLAVIRSTDNGATWGTAVNISSIAAFGANDPTTGAPIRDGAILAQMAVGRDGSLHAVWQDARFTGVRDSIAYSRSTDGGLTWSTPVRINSDPTVVAFTPQVHVRDDGMIGITYYDLRSDTPSRTELLTDFWIARSADGVTWTETRVSAPFDISIAPNALGYFLGDYTGLTATSSSFIAFYGKTNAGNLQNRTDIFAARISTAPAGTVAAKRARFEESAPYRAQSLPAEDPGPEFWAAVSEHTRRVLELRRQRFMGPDPSMR